MEGIKNEEIIEIYAFVNCCEACDEHGLQAEREKFTNIRVTEGKKRLQLATWFTT